MAILVSKQGHCLIDLLWRWDEGELDAEIPLVISNHDDLRSKVEAHGIAFHHLPLVKEAKVEQEAQVETLLREHAIDLVVLARYMQVISPRFLESYRQPIINIHHSFLPAFVGANPYRQAHARGVKIIGATAHYVTAELDAGPIIHQGVAHISHKDGLDDMIRIGRDVERRVWPRPCAGTWKTGCCWRGCGRLCLSDSSSGDALRLLPISVAGGRPVCYIRRIVSVCL